LTRCAVWATSLPPPYPSKPHRNQFNMLRRTCITYRHWESCSGALGACSPARCPCAVARYGQEKKKVVWPLDQRYLARIRSRSYWPSTVDHVLTGPDQILAHPFKSLNLDRRSSILWPRKPTGSVFGRFNPSPRFLIQWLGSWHNPSVLAVFLKSPCSFTQSTRHPCRENMSRGNIAH
jgi:hypothetical protein